MFHLIARRLWFIALLSTLFLSHRETSLAQSPDLRQLPTSTVQIKEQQGCPISLGLVKAEAPADDRSVVLSVPYRFVSYTKVLAYVVLADANIGGTPQSMATFRGADMIRSSEGLNKYYVDLKGKTLPEKIILSVDYVSFADGTSWGDDAAKKSIWVEGAMDGARAAFNELLRVGPAEDQDRVQKIRDFSKARVSLVPEVPQNQKGADWNAGFKTGYQSVLGNVLLTQPMRPEAFLGRFEEVRARLIDNRPVNP